VLVETTAPDAYTVASEGGYSAGVSMEITPELLAEGTAREVIRLIQNLRKDSGLEISDRIQLFISVPEDVQASLSENVDYVREETLALSVTFGESPDGAHIVANEINDAAVTIGIVKAG
jgi:isoleucyl-tRNA synthetase